MKKEEIDAMNTSEKRQIELLEKYFKVDRAKKTVDVRVAYDKASDLFYERIGNVEHPLMKDAIFEQARRIGTDIPDDYRVSLNVCIADYEDYSPSELVSSLKDLIELSYFRGEKKQRRKAVLAAVLATVGIFLLFLMGYSSVNAWFGTGEIASLVNEVIDIAAWVFIWESVTVLFLEPNESTLQRASFVRRIRLISFCDRSGKEIVQEDVRDLSRVRLEDGNKVKVVFSSFFIVSGILFILLGVNSIFNAVLNLTKEGTDLHKNMGFFVPILIYALVEIGTGISALESYLHKGTLRKWALASAEVILVLSVVLLVAGASNADLGASTRGFAILSLIVSFLFSAGYYGYQRYIR